VHELQNRPVIRDVNETLSTRPETSNFGLKTEIMSRDLTFLPVIQVICRHPCFVLTIAYVFDTTMLILYTDNIPERELEKNIASTMDHQNGETINDCKQMITDTADQIVKCVTRTINEGDQITDSTQSEQNHIASPESVLEDDHDFECHADLCTEAFQSRTTMPTDLHEIEQVLNRDPSEDKIYLDKSKHESLNCSSPLGLQRPSESEQDVASAAAVPPLSEQVAASASSQTQTSPTMAINMANTAFTPGRTLVDMNPPNNATSSEEYHSLGDDAVSKYGSQHTSNVCGLSEEPVHIGNFCGISGNKAIGLLESSESGELQVDSKDPISWRSHDYSPPDYEFKADTGRAMVDGSIDRVIADRAMFESLTIYAAMIMLASFFLMATEGTGSSLWVWSSILVSSVLLFLLDV